MRRIHRARGGRSLEGRREDLYGLAVLALLYVVPACFIVLTRAESWEGPSDPETAGWLGAAAVASTIVTAQLVGRSWGPLVMNPFELYVLRSTDLPPVSFLGRVAATRCAMLAAVLGVPLTGLAVVVAGTSSTAERIATGSSALAAAAAVALAWLIGQAATWRANALLGVGAMVYASLGALDVPGRVLSMPVVSVLTQGSPRSSGDPWGLLCQLVLTGLIGLVAVRSVREVDLDRLARESARASQAQLFVGTGSFHDALDLYRPVPRGLQGAGLRPDGRRRGHLVVGAVRAARTPWRAAAASLLLLVGPGCVLLGSGPTEAGSIAATAGAVMTYLGAGWAAESWRGLRDELTMPPLFGPGGGGASARALVFPVTATVTTSLVVAAFLDGARMVTLDLASVVLLASTLAVALSSRLLREMKRLLPLHLLTPVATPFGDVSALRVLAWQLDGLIVVVLTSAVVTEMSSAVTSGLVALSVSIWCLDAALRRVGSSLWRVVRSTGRTSRG